MKRIVLSHPVGKQSTLQKASEEGITEIEKLQIENRKVKMQIDILKKVPRNREESMKDENSIKEICILIGIPRSTYYRWKNKAKDIKESEFFGNFHGKSLSIWTLKSCCFIETKI